MRYKRSHLIGLFAALLVLVTILGGGILLVIKEAVSYTHLTLPTKRIV